MICPNCRHENPPEAAFCMQCGTPLRIACASCGATLPAQARFCLRCGQPVAVNTPSDEARLKRLAAAMPPPLAEKMRAAHLRGERKVVTAVFADVVGSTALAERMDAEDWTLIMNHAFDYISPTIYRYEGTIARLMGDAILAFFGAPVAHEDDPVRAVRASLDLLEAVRQYAEDARQDYGIVFQMRVGLNTGPVVVGEVGSDLKYEYTAMGDAVNLAARMQAAARPMTVLISDNTHRFVAPIFDCADLGQIDVKGKSEPVRVYEVIGAKAEPGRVRGVAGLESPMVGRDAELSALLQTSAAARAGLGRVAVVIGEPGLGKSRLIAEWRLAVLDEGRRTKDESVVRQPSSVEWAEGHCLSYGRGLAYHLLIDVLRSLIGVPAAASDAETREALHRLCDDVFGPVAQEVYPYLGNILSLRLEGDAAERVKQLDPQALQTQYLAALRQLLKALAARRPMTLVLDDVHWADPSSVELLVKLLPLASEARLLFCFVTRPEHDAPGWKLVAAARETLGASLSEVTLNPLSDDDSQRLVSNLLDIGALPEHAQALILKKAEGNPFFVEEVIRMLIDRGAIVRTREGWSVKRAIDQVDIPDNLHSLLTARIDRLPDDVKRTLRVASVIGRQFSLRVLEEVLGESDA